MSFDVLIVEDEPLVGQRLQRLTRELLGPELGYLRLAGTLAEGQSCLTERPFDLLVLDLNLHGRDGFDVLRTCVAGAFQTIVVSASVDRAVEAFEYGVLDFVPKPFGRERLAKALGRLTTPRPRGGPETRYLAVREAGGTRVIAVEEVDHVQGAGTYAELVMRNGATALHDKTLEQLEAILSEDFVRIHKSYLVRWPEVRRLRALEGSRYELEMKDGRTFPVGRSRYPSLRERLG